MTNENNPNLTEMTRDKLLFSICPMDMKYDCCNADSNLNCDYCNRLLNKWLDEYDKQIRADAIDEFFEMLKNPITLDRLTSSRDKIKTLSIIKYQYGVIKGDFKVGE